MKKQILFIGALLATTVVGFSQNIYNSDGTLQGNRTVNMDGRNLTFRPSVPNSEFFINGTTGFVGLGVLAPTSRLDVNGVIKGKNLLATNTSTALSTFTSIAEWFRNTNVFGAGYEMINPSISGTTRRLMNFYDIFGGSSPGSGLQNDDKVVFNIVDRDNKERFKYFARKGSGGDGLGSSYFALMDKNESEFFKVFDAGNGMTGMQLATSTSKVIIGGYLDYVPGLPHKFVVQNGSALIEGNMITNGNIGIGTQNFIDGADTYRLSVKGAIRAERVKVYTTWADYVFEKEYHLPTLEEVEKHIVEKGHLQDIPSAKEVEANGIELGEMNKLLLQKVEELTLYIIQLNKDIKNLKKI